MGLLLYTYTPHCNILDAYRLGYVCMHSWSLLLKELAIGRQVEKELFSLCNRYETELKR